MVDSVRLTSSEREPENRLCVNGDVNWMMKVIYEAIGKHEKSMSEMLAWDCGVSSSEDMLYFPKELYGKLPTYGEFILFMRKINKGDYDEYREIETDIEMGKLYNSLGEIANKDKIELGDRVKFSMTEKLLKIKERNLDRLEKKRDKSNKEEVVDLASKIIERLSNKELKDTLEAIKVIESAK